jgi:hypothetical protein
VKSRPIVTRVDPRAARYLELLIDFGHLDARGVEEVLLAASDAYAGTDRPIPLAAVQRVAAATLVNDRSVPAGTEDLLTQDWPLLFY